MIMRSYESCAKAKTFFEKLKAAIGDGGSGWFGRRKVLSEHVFEAHLSDVAKKLDQEPEVKKKLLGGLDEASRKKKREDLQKTWGSNVKLGLLEYVRAADDDTLSFNNGQAIYIGTVKDGRTYQHGTMYFSSGTIIRGKFDYVTPRTSGDVDKIYPDGRRRVGYDDYENTGKPLKDMPQHVAELNGDIYEGGLDGNEKRNGQGTLKDANGKLKETGTFSNGELYIGKRYDESGAIIAQVDKPAEARKQAEDKRLAAEAAAAAAAQRIAEEQRARDEANAREEQRRVQAAAIAKGNADKAFKESIAKLNAGELFVLATKLDREGNADNALEARSALVSRFPNHPLAATAAQQMAATSSGSSQSASNAAGATSSAPSSPTKAAAASSASPPKYPSVCERNLSKLNNLVYDRKIRQAGALYDLFLRDYNLDGAKVLEPCIGTSASAARTYKAAMDEANRITQYCSGPHDKRLECRQWGDGASENQGNPYDNRAWYTGWKADVDRALADPQNFSAELGTAAGANTATASTTDAAADRCAAKLKSIEASFNAAQPSIPKNSVVVLSEATMWMLTESINIIESTCPNSVNYRGQAAQFRQTLAQTKQVCDRSSTRPCIAQLPGRAPGPPPPQAASPLKPLENKPPASCEPSSSTGLSFTSCAREACESGGGSFAIGSTGCAGCTRAGGSWTLCPKGSGGVNSAQ